MYDRDEYWQERGKAIGRESASPECCFAGALPAGALMIGGKAMTETGLIHVYYGDGKGKTTCGMGLCCRAAGAGLRVLVFQFMKDGRGNERQFLEKDPNIVFAGNRRSVCFSFQMSGPQKEEERAYYRKMAAAIRERLRQEPFDVLFLDEALYAVSCGLLEESVLTDLLDNRPERLEVILTGGTLPEAIRERADYLSRISKEKHPYDRGIGARNGIEF